MVSLSSKINKIFDVTFMFYFCPRTFRVFPLLLGVCSAIKCPMDCCRLVGYSMTHIREYSIVDTRQYKDSPPNKTLFPTDDWDYLTVRQLPLSHCLTVNSQSALEFPSDSTVACFLNIDLCNTKFQVKMKNLGLTFAWKFSIRDMTSRWLIVLWNWVTDKRYDFCIEIQLTGINFHALRQPLTIILYQNC